MGFTLYHPSLQPCKSFFNLFNNITNNTAIIINKYGLHVTCSNKRFQIHSVLDEISFKDYTCSQEYILALSIQNIRTICEKHSSDESIQIIYSDQQTLLFIINNKSTYSIPCSHINNPVYIERIQTVDDLDYQIEFEIEAKYIYALIKQIFTQTAIHNKLPKTLTFRSDVSQQCVYINDININDININNINNIDLSTYKKIDLYPFVKNINETYAFAYINQIIKNTITQKISTLLFGLYKDKSMKITSCLDDYNYIEYYIRSLS